MIIVGTKEEAIAALRTVNGKIRALQRALKNMERPVFVCPERHVHSSELIKVHGYLKEAREKNITLTKDATYWETVALKLQQLVRKHVTSSKRAESGLDKKTTEAFG